MWTTKSADQFPAIALLRRSCLLDLQHNENAWTAKERRNQNAFFKYHPNGSFACYSY
jgi:hypothetical protein